MRPLIVRASSSVIRCTSCGHPTGYESPVVVELPPVTKTVIYLDQFVYEHIRTRSGAWAELGDKLDLCVRAQVIACPVSDLHGLEALLAPDEMTDREGIMADLSAGVRFHFERDLRLAQTVAAAASWLDGTTIDPLARRSAIASGSIQSWLPLMQVWAPFPRLDEVTSELRHNLDALHAQVQTIFERWQGNPLRGAAVFNVEYEKERDGFVVGCATSFMRYLEQIQASVAPTFEDLVASMSMEVCTRLQLLFTQRGMTSLEASQKVIAFLGSPEAREMPFLRIQAAIWAAIAQAAAAGQRSNLQSTPNDIQAISTYLPFCDAMFIDRTMAGLLRGNPLRQRLDDWGFQGRIFSAATRANFTDYLDSLLHEAPPAQLAYADLLYGTSLGPA